MDNQEAINELMDYIAENDKTTISIETVRIAIEALEKQIPKEPDFEGDGYADGHLVYDTWICPNCGVKYEVDYEEYPHCPDCGQAIFWNKLQYADNETAQSGLMPAT